MAHTIVASNLDFESTAKALNIAQLTLSNAAGSDAEPIRKQEYDVDVTDLQTRVTSLENNSGLIEHVHVDTTSADLATALAAGSYANDVWTFGTDELTTGDLLVLTAATQQDSDRSWIMNGTNLGTTADFTALGTDIDAAIQAAISGVVGDAATDYNTLGKLEDKHIALDTRVGTAESDITTLESDVALRPIHRVIAGSFVDNGDGTYTATLAHPYNNTALMYVAQTEVVEGTWDYVALTDVDVTTTQLIVNTNSVSIGTHDIRLLVSGFDI